jgi:predicted RNA binding protein YcfA (HicA-like mRNA interferase family)
VPVAQALLVAVTLWAMAIDDSQLRRLTVREMMSALICDGYSLSARAGNHLRDFHPDGRRVTVAFHHPAIPSLPTRSRA